MTLTLDATDDDAPCTSCGATSGSCDVRRWLGGRPCCTSCTGPRSHQSGGHHVAHDHLDHDDHDLHLVHLDHDDHLDLDHHQLDDHHHDGDHHNLEHHDLEHLDLDHHEQPQPRPSGKGWHQ